MRSSVLSAAIEAPPLDLDHLDQQTGGDLLLQRELLALFTRQSAALLAEIEALARQSASSVRIPELAHQLKGAALALGAFRIAAAAEALEETFTSNDLCAEVGPTARDAAAANAAARAHAVQALSAAQGQALAAITAYLRRLDAGAPG